MNIANKNIWIGLSVLSICAILGFSFFAKEESKDPLSSILAEAFPIEYAKADIKADFFTSTLNPYSGEISERISSCIETTPTTNTGRVSGNVDIDSLETLLAKKAFGELSNTDIKASLMPVFGHAAFTDNSINWEWKEDIQEYDFHVYPGDEAFWICYFSQDSDFFSLFFSEVELYTPEATETPTSTVAATASETDDSTTSIDYTGEYSISDDEYETSVTVTIDNNVRTITSNALPNHEVGTFPNEGNPNAISEQSITREYPYTPTFTGSATWAREPGVAINGVKFEPETNERVTCETGEIYKIEAIQNITDLGLDFNNAHVQPTGEYHYHGVSLPLVGTVDSIADLIHVGFAADGYLMYYSQSGAYSSSFEKIDGPRSGENCSYPSPQGGVVDGVDENAEIGTYTSDWEYSEGLGDLDSCNGTTLPNGEYVYIITNEFPYIPRCLNGESEGEGGQPGGPPPTGAGPPDSGATTSPEVTATIAAEVSSLSAETIADYYSDSIVGDVDIVDCTLSGGTQTQCYEFTVAPDATSDHSIGPWCPTNISDADSEGGIWPDGGEINPVSGAFVANLSSFYNDDNWQLYDESTGDIKVTDTQVACEGAAKPDVDVEYQNYCVECQLSYMDEIPNVTYTIPVNPEQADTTQAVNGTYGTGVAFNGIKFDASAPTSNILSAYTIAPFDDCGGHINLIAGYHYHEHTGCSKEIDIENHEPMIGLALDGFAMYSQTDDSDLDSCNGHMTESEGYHYHISETGSNQFLGCYAGESGCASTDGTSCDASAASSTGPGGAGGPPQNGMGPPPGQ